MRGGGREEIDKQIDRQVDNQTDWEVQREEEGRKKGRGGRGEKRTWLYHVHNKKKLI